MLRIFIRDLKLDIVIGAYAHEKHTPQQIVINLEATVIEPENIEADDLEQVVDYAKAAETIISVAKKKSPVILLETLAASIAAELMQDERILDLSLRLEKTQIYPGAGSVGIQLYKKQS